MWKSIQEYACAVLHWWWVMVIGFVSGGAGYAVNIWQGLQIPIWVWIALAVLGLFVAQFFAFHKIRVERDNLKQQLNDKAKLKQIREQLGEYVRSGTAFMTRCRNQELIPDKEIEEWEIGITHFLSINLGNSYISRFNSDAGLSAVTISGSIKCANLWSSLNCRVARLNEFIAEFRD